jgi:uncharacterized damage-inducible protein DinB
MSRPLLQDAFDHHIWATLTLIDACSELSPEQLEMSAPGTYGSVIATLRHIAAGDAGYLSLLSNGAVPMIIDEQEAAMTLADLRAVMEADGKVWPDVISADRDPDEMIARHRDDGSDSYAPFGIRLNQAVQHGADHRSQVCTVLTTLGVDPPELDVWAYGRSKGWLKVVEPASA